MSIILAPLTKCCNSSATIGVIVFWAAASAASAQTNCAPAPAGLISWWRGEGNVLDEAGGNHGTNVGNTTFESGRVGQGFLVDGSGDGVNVGNSASLQLQNFTIETWIKRAHPSRATQSAASSGNLFAGSAGAYNLGLLDDGRLFLSKINFSAVFSTVTITDTNGFHHVAVTKSGDNVMIYVDGQGEAIGPYDPGFVFTGPMAIGARGGDYTASFFGSIDEMSVYDRALATNEIQAIYSAGSIGKCLVPPTIAMQPKDTNAVVGGNAAFTVAVTGSQPMSYQWSFNDTNLTGATVAQLTLTNVQSANAGVYSVAVSNVAGTALSSNAVLTVLLSPPCVVPATGLVSWWRGEGNALDQKGGNHGTLSGGTTFGAGRVGEAFVFNGNGAAVLLGNPANLRLQDLTIEFWIRRASASVTSLNGNGNGHIFGFNNGGYGVYLDPNGVPTFSKVAFNEVKPAVAITDTNLHHVAVTKTNNAIVFYVDGVAYPAAAYNPGFTFADNAYIGGLANNYTFYGTLDEVSVYNRVLTASEIQDIYNAGITGKCAVTFAPFITTGPTNRSTTVGGTTTFHVVAGGTEPLSYQWLLNGTNLVSATASALSLTDVQLNQAGSYSVQVTNSAGSATSSNATLTVAFPTAVVRLGGTNAMAGGPVTVPVTLAASGNENGLGLSVNFNTQRLAFASATLGGGGAGATLLVNTTMISTGRVGIAVAFPPHLNFSSGTQEVVRLTFNSLPLFGGAAANATNSFADQPILRELYDAQLQSLPAFYSNGIVTLQPSVFEADVYPRPGGNQGLSGTDWSQAGRFAARLDTATAGGEFQRADCAPRGTLGDGKLKITDWVQAGRYLAGLDSLTAVGGPTNETAAVSDSAPVSRQLRVGGTNGPQAQMVHMPVVLEAQGNENALGFTVAYPPEAFVFAGIAPGSGAAGATLILNTNQAGAGRVGVALGLPVGGVFAAGTKELVRVSLLPLPEVAGALPVTLSDALVTRCVSDAGANELPVNYADGVVAISPADPRPPLWIAATGTNVVLSWPLWAAEFALQTVADPGASGGWTNQPIELETNAWRVSGTLPADADAHFFRLFRP